MAKETPAQQKTVERVMHEYKHGELQQRGGKRVKDPKQAIAIALHEAGASNREDSKTNTRSLARTKAKEHAGKTGQARAEGQRAASPENTRVALYAEAKRKKIAGRSTMTKAELARAVQA